jgi:hypothetical protein
VLVIRDQMMEAFRRDTLHGFEDEMVVHFGGFSPPLVNAVGEEQIRKMIDFGIVQAGSYRLTYRGPVRLYLELMLLFGSYFGEDPQYPWATEILSSSGPQMQRAELLYEKTLEYRRTVAGPEDIYTVQALRRIRVLAEQSLPFSAQNFVSAVLHEIRQIYPQKADHVGSAGLEALIHKGIERARDYHFSELRQITLLIVLMLAFGHGCLDDPLYPWIARTLKDEIITDPVARANRLTTKALTWLDHVLSYFESGSEV